MIVTRLALPVRSPMPLIVPCTCVAPASTAASVLATAQPESSWVWIPSATPGSASRDDGERRADLRRQRAAVGVAQHDPLGARVGGGAQAVQRVAGVEREAVEEVLGVEQHALARADEEGDRLGDHREVLLARDAHDLLDVQHRGLADERADRREAARPARAAPRPRSAATSRRRVIPKATISATLEALVARAARTARCSFGFDAGKPASIRCTPSSSSACTTRSFSSAVRRHAAAAHAVAQGGVVELYVGHRP